MHLCVYSIYLFLDIELCVCVYIYIHTYIHTYIRTYIHTYIYKYTYIIYIYIRLCPFLYVADNKVLKRFEACLASVGSLSGRLLGTRVLLTGVRMPAL